MEGEEKLKTEAETPARADGYESFIWIWLRNEKNMETNNLLI